MKRLLFSIACASVVLLASCIDDRPTVREVGGLLVPPIDPTATSDDAEKVTIRWGVDEQSFPSAFVIQRAGEEIATVPGDARSYDDVAAPAGAVTAPTGLTASQGTSNTAVRLAWIAPTTAPGASQFYQVVAVFGLRGNVISAPFVGQRAAPLITGYDVSRDDGKTWSVSAPSTGNEYEDVGAPGASELTLTGTAEPDPLRHLVRLSAKSTFGPAPHLVFRVRAATNIGPFPASSPADGWRDTQPTLDIQWQRSSGDADANYTDLPGVTGHLWFDPSPVLDQARYYRARAADPASQAVSLGARTIVFDAAEISARGAMTCIRRSDGRIVCRNNGTTSAPTLFPYKALSVGGTFWCGIDANDHLDCPGAPFLPDTASTYKSVAAGAAHACAIRLDNRLECFGANANGEAPPGPTTDELSSVTAGNGFTCGLTTTGALVCRGANAQGQAPLGPSIDTFKQIAAADQYACGIRADDHMVCWGAGQDGSPSLDKYKRISAGNTQVCGIRLDDTVTCLGESPAAKFESIAVAASHVCGVHVDGVVECWGSNAAGRAPRRPPVGTFESISLGTNQTCAVTGDGSLDCFGTTKPPPGIFRSIANGASHACALRTDGLPVCWGAIVDAPTRSLSAIVSRASYACGLATNSSIPFCWGAGPPSIVASPLFALAAGTSHACGIRTDQRVACWGANGSGQAPDEATADTFKSISAGAAHTCGIRTDGKLVCWGDNTAGQAPTVPSTRTMHAVAGGNGFTCTIGEVDRSIACVGNLPTPKFPAHDGYAAIAAGATHACALRSDKKLLCWGDDSSHQAPTP